MEINPVVYSSIIQYIYQYLENRKSVSIRNLIKSFNGPPGIMEWEIRFTINKLLYEGYLKVTKIGKMDDYNEISVNKTMELNSNSVIVKIVVSKPRLREFRLDGILERNTFIETKKCFTELILSAKHDLRVSSPFLEKNIISPDAFPELKYLLLEAFNRGVKIKILSREISSRRENHINWLIDLKKKSNNQGRLIIADYHISQEKSIVSSTHAKIIISDNKFAYTGSAELRKNSIIANFEIGCYISGSQVAGMCEIFDMMFSKGKICVDL